MTEAHLYPRGAFRARIGVTPARLFASLALFLLAPFLAIPCAASATRPTYAEAIAQTLSEMEEGKHAKAAVTLKKALTLDRNDPAGVLALGTLYLHTGSSTRAAREFARVRAVAPDDPLGPWGEALASLALGKISETSRHLDLVSAAEVPAAPLLRAYVRLLSGDGESARQATGEVTADEADLLRLQLGGMAALRSGGSSADTARGETLLNALLQRPTMQRLEEERAAILSFLDAAPVQGAAPMLASAIGFPEAAANNARLSGFVTLAPPISPSSEVAVVTYSVEGGGGFNASVNYAPWAVDWNTARFPNGLYTIRTAALDGSGRTIAENSRTVTIWNKNAPASRLLTAEQRAAYRQRLLALLTPRPSRKAAHFALAEAAVKRGDSEGALRHIEAVVAIDPLYQNARASLRRFNHTTLGSQDGIWRGVTKEKIVALTFDDGPNPASNRTPALLDVLQTAGIPATFFVVGLRAEQSPDLLRRMSAEGHEIANHSYSHPNLTYLDTYALEKELCRTSVIIREATGKRPHFYRPPGGNFNRAVVSAAELLGMAGAYWTVDAIKFESAPFTSKQVSRYVLNNIRPGAIVLLHNAPFNTIAALPEIVSGLKAKGYQCVTMSELARRCKTVGAAKKPAAIAAAAAAAAAAAPRR